MNFPISLPQPRTGPAASPRVATGVDGQRRAAARRVVVVPVYNEAGAVLGVLNEVEALGFDALIVVDDGSSDASGALLDGWAAGRAAVQVVHLDRNQGKSAALRVAWDRLREGLERGEFDHDTVVVGVDADGQHDLAEAMRLVARLEATGADAVIARRDLSYHGPLKRLGNHAMTALGSLLGGGRLYDIESGFRVTRLGPLLHAQEFYRGRRYSEASELAVVLKRLGYHVDNEYVVRVPVTRSRTRLSDAVAHVVAMAGAWYRVACWKAVRRGQRSRFGAVAAAALIVMFLAYLGALLTHRVFLGDDSAQSYAHVWFIAERLYAGEWIPLRMANLESGRAYTFPYGALPWIPTALVRPVLGDWAVTASMVAGVGLLFLGLWRWLPRTATPLMTGLVLLNWQLWNGILQFQLLTVWGFAFACLAAAEFDRGRPRRGAALAVGAIYAHPLMGGLALGMTQLARLERVRRIEWRRYGWLAAAAAVSAPAIWMFLTTPAVADAAAWSPLVTAQVLGRRLSILAWPWLIQRFRPAATRWHVPAFLVGAMFLVVHVGQANPRNLRWESLPRFPDYLAAGLLDPEARYRVLTTSNQEDGMTQLLQAGATLAHEYFDESVHRHSFADAEAYRCFLEEKRATRVLVHRQWATKPGSNEVALLDELVSRGEAQLTFRGGFGTLEYTIRGGPPASCAAGT